MPPNLKYSFSQSNKESLETNPDNNAKGSMTTFRQHFDNASTGLGELLGEQLNDQGRQISPGKLSYSEILSLLLT